MLRIIFSIGLFQVVNLVLNAARSKIFAVFLGPAGFGIVATVDQLVLSIAQLCNFGLPFTAMKFLSRSHSLGEEAFRKSYAAFLHVIIGLALVSTLLAATLLPLILDHLDPQLAQHRGTVLIALLGLPALLLMMFFVNAFAARQESMRSALLTVLFSAAILIFGGLGCWWGGIRGIYLGAVPATSGVIAIMWLILRRRMKLTGAEHLPSIWAELKSNNRILQTTLYTYLSVASIAAVMLLARYESITKLSAEAAGLFQACLAIAMSIGAVLGPANSLYLSPYVNRSIPALEKTGAVTRFLPRLVLLFFLGALPALLFPELVLRILFSGRFTSAASLLPWFVFWQYVSQIATVYQHLLIGLDDMRGFCKAVVFGSAVTAVGCLFFIRPFGLAGLGAAFVTGSLASLALTVLRLSRHHRLLIPAAVARLICFGLAAFALMPMSRLLGQELTAGGIGFRLLIATGLLFLLWLLLPDSLRDELSARFKRHAKS
ncbi:MAG: oligosaccharide flippase family protein [Chthoniobacterales bacterium]|nr:oligosaccharide flippase family protein [Chthoniobacterales bacterium]